jgi:hypothetical protein
MENHITPGPYKVCYRDDEWHMSMSVIVPEKSPMVEQNICRLSDDKNKNDVIAIVLHQIPPYSGRSIEEAEANELLFAASWEMLEALECAYKYMVHSVPQAVEIIEKMESAICKAKGISIR